MSLEHWTTRPVLCLAQRNSHRPGREFASRALDGRVCGKAVKLIAAGKLTQTAFGDTCAPCWRRCSPSAFAAERTVQLGAAASGSQEVEARLAPTSTAVRAPVWTATVTGGWRPALGWSKNTRSSSAAPFLCGSYGRGQLQRDDRSTPRHPRQCLPRLPRRSSRTANGAQPQHYLAP